VVIEPIQRPRLQHVDHPGQLDERSTHSTGRGGGGPVERLYRTHERIIATDTDNSADAITEGAAIIRCCGRRRRVVAVRARRQLQADLTNMTRQSIN